MPVARSLLRGSSPTVGRCSSDDAAEYQAWWTRSGPGQAQVTRSRDPDDAEREAITRELAACGAQVVPPRAVNPEILGGVVVKGGHSHRTAPSAAVAMLSTDAHRA